MALTLDHLQQREEHWAIVDLIGKGGHIRTVPVPDWVRAELDDWLAAATIDRGRLFRRVNKVGRTWGDGMTVTAVWHIVKESARSIGVSNLAPHDLWRTCARLCHASGGELEQIQFLLGRDTRLGRDVAIKVQPSHLSSNPDLEALSAKVFPHD